MKVLIAYRRAFMIVAALAGLYAACSMLAACGLPVWLTDASGIIALVGSSFTSVASFIAGLTGNAALAAALATVSTWITKIQTALGDIETLVEQYQEAENPTVLADIEAALADLETNLQTDFSNLGLPSGVLSVIAGIAGLALSQLQAWAALISGMKATAAQKVEFNVPLTKKEFKAAVNKILSTPTGDPQVDAALAKAQRV